MLTETQKQEYIKNSVICPYCKSNELTTIGQISTDINCAWQDVKCDSCGKRWTDWYTLTGIGEEDAG